MSYNTPRHGWGVRTPIEVLGRTAIVHAVLIVNYIFLQRTQKVKYSSRTAQVLRIVLFGFMPTLVVAELALNAIRIFLLFLQSDSTKLTLKIALSNWKRYLCGLAGMHVAPRPELEQDVDEEVAGEEQQQPESSADVSDTPAKATNPDILPRLSKIQDSDDLEHHRQRWSLLVVGQILLLLLPIAQAVGTITLWTRRIADWYWHDPLSLDKRNLVAACSSIACSLLAITILACRSEWSLKILHSAENIRREYIIRTFFIEIVLASILNEMPFQYVWRVQPFSWFDTVTHMFGPGGIIFYACFALLIWILVVAFDEQIKKRVTINWHFVLGIPVAIITIWIFIDLFAYVVYDIVLLADRDGYDGYWDKDPISNYLPIC